MIRVKICGIQWPEEALAVAAAGANAIGVIVATMARSEHAVLPSRAAEVFRALAESPEPVARNVKRVLVTHETDTARLERLVEECSFTQEVQLHAPMDGPLFQRNLGLLQGLRIDITRAAHVTPGATVDAIIAAARNSTGAFALLLDSATADRLGGTGHTHDWSISAEVVRRSPLPVILAGGLRAENIRAAAEQVRPSGVDLNTGARERGNRLLPQSPERVRELVRLVREAEAGLQGFRPGFELR